MVTYAEIKSELSEHKKEFDRLYKCLVKTKIPKTQTKQKHLKDIIIIYNLFTDLVYKYYFKCTKQQQAELNEAYQTIRVRLVKLFEFLDIVTTVPTNFNTNVTYSEPDEDDEVIFEGDFDVRNENSSYNLDFDLNFDQLILNMAEEAAKAKTQWLSTYTKVIPEFDGTFENLTRFIDACELVDDNVGIYMDTAIRIIKTKLVGTSRNFITNETTIVAIIDTLKNNVKAETSKSASAKLLSLKQGNKTPNDYIKELENMTASLKRAYLNEGVPVTCAETYATETIVKSIVSNTQNEKIRTVMQSADFKSTVEVSTKFVNACTEVSANKPQILYNRKFNSNRGNQRGHRGNYRNFNRNNAGRNNYGNNNSNQNNGYNNNNGNYNNHSGQRSNNYRGSNQRGNNRNIRYAENSQPPQMILGANSTTSSQ